jgi:single-strand DNA-binding protein
MNKVLLVGRLTKDPRVEEKSSGKMMGHFNLAVEGLTKKAKVDFILIKVWDSLAAIVRDNCYKGMMVSVEGRVVTSNYEKDGKMHFTMEIHGDNIKFLAGKKEMDSSKQTSADYQTA